MKNRKHQKSYGSADGDPSSEEMCGEMIGTKEFYNWSYQKEEEDYYLSEEASGSLPDFSQEALFVEY